MNKQIKSKKRVSDFGEVFTNQREVKAMCDLVKDETQRIDSRFLEPACGEGVFLIEILTRKLKSIKNNWIINSLIAISNIYGIDIMKDNCEICRRNLYKIWFDEYKNKFETQNEKLKDFVKFILSKNIICGNTLSTYCVDENQKETQELICFSDWKFINNYVYRKEFALKNLLNEQQEFINDEIFAYKLEL
jgi:hypothetical protein